MWDVSGSQPQGVAAEATAPGTLPGGAGVIGKGLLYGPGSARGGLIGTEEVSAMLAVRFLAWVGLRLPKGTDLQLSPDLELKPRKSPPSGQGEEKQARVSALPSGTKAHVCYDPWSLPASARISRFPAQLTQCL